MIMLLVVLCLYGDFHAEMYQAEIVCGLPL